MTIEVKFTANTSDELFAEMGAFMAANGAKTEAPKPATRGGKKTEDKAAEAAELRRTVGTTATVVEAPAEPTQTDEDPLGETVDETLEEAVTLEDVRKLLVEVKAAYPKKPTLISEIVKNHGGAAKLADVPAEKFADIAAAAKKHLASAGK